ncbi:MAG: hypothetical protein WAN70_18395 [Terriglobales bacterium]
MKTRSKTVAKLFSTPAFLSHLPVVAGMPVPVFVTWFDGVPDFRVPDTQKVAECLKLRLCGICGRKLGEHMYFIGGPLSKANKLFNDPPMHKACAEFSSRVCPYLTGKRQDYSRRAVPDKTRVTKLMAHGRPAELFILKARTKDLALTQVQGKYLITITKNFVGCAKLA